MDSDSFVARILHLEHDRNLDLMRRLEMLARGPWQGQLPNIGDERLSLLLNELDYELATATHHHFEFEEKKIFPALYAVGDVTIPFYLRQEHNFLRNLSEFMLPKVEAIRRHGFNTDGWVEFRDLSLELSARHVRNIQHEEAAMLPALEGLFAEQRESELISLYAEA